MQDYVGEIIRRTEQLEGSYHSECERAEKDAPRLAGESPVDGAGILCWISLVVHRTG